MHLSISLYPPLFSLATANSQHKHRSQPTHDHYLCYYHHYHYHHHNHKIITTPITPPPPIRHYHPSPTTLQTLETTWSSFSGSGQRDLGRRIFVCLVHFILLPFTGAIQFISPAPKTQRRDLRRRRKRREGNAGQQQQPQQKHQEHSVTVPTGAGKPRDKSWWLDFLTSRLWEMDRPQTRCIRHWASYLYFLLFLLFEINKAEKKNLAKYGKQPDFIEWTIIIYLIGSTFQILFQIKEQVLEVVVVVVVVVVVAVVVVEAAVEFI